MADEWYDADGDVSRFLRSPRREDHLLDVPEPEAAQIHHAPEAMPDPALAPMMLGLQGPAVDAEQHQAPPVLLGFERQTVDAGQHQAPPEMLVFQQITLDAGQHDAPLAVGFPATAATPAAIGFTAPAVDVGHYPAPPAFGFSSQQMVNVGGHTVPTFGYQALLLGVDQEPEFDADILGVEHHQAQAFGFPAPNLDIGYHHQEPPVGFQQASAVVDVQHHQAPVFGFQDAPAWDNEPHQSGFQGPTNNEVEHQPAVPFVFQAPAIGASHHHQAPAMDTVQQHQAPDMDDIEHHQEPEMVDVEHHEEPEVDDVEKQEDPDMEDVEILEAPDMNNVEQNQAPAMDDVEHHQAPATDVQPPAPEKANGGVPEPTPGEGLGAGVKEYTWFHDLDADPALHIPPSPLRSPQEEVVPPAADGLTYVPLVEGQLDCARCRTVRVLLHQTELYKLQFVVHAGNQGAFQHAVLHRRRVGADGQVQANEPLYVDFRNHSHGKVKDFIGSNVEFLRNLSSGRLQDKCSHTSTAPPNNNSQAELEEELRPEGDALAYASFVEGQLDCSRCRTARELLHETERHKLQFVVHAGSQGAFQHAILHRTRVDADGQVQRMEPLFVDFRNSSLTSVRDFIDRSVEFLRKMGSGRLQDKCSYLRTGPPNNNSHAELEASMLGNILMPTAAVNGNGAAPGSSSQPVVQEEQNKNAPEASSQNPSPPVAQPEQNNNAENRFKPGKYLGFTPEILESSLVKPYDPKSDTNVLLYPSMLEKIRARQQARESNLTLEDVSRMLAQMEEEAATEPDFSSMLIFNQLCREDNTYRKHARRIKDLNKKIKGLKKSLHQGLNARALFIIKQKALMHRQEKEDLFTLIDMGLEEYPEVNNEDAAGPSGS